MSKAFRNCCAIALMAMTMTTCPAWAQGSKQPKAYSNSQMSNLLDQMDRGTIPNQQQRTARSTRRVRNIGSRGFRARPMPQLRRPMMGNRGGMGMMGGGGGMPGMMGSGGGGAKAQFLQKLMGGGGMMGGGAGGGAKAQFLQKLMGGGGGGMPGGSSAHRGGISGMVGGGRPSMMGMGGGFGTPRRKPMMHQTMPQHLGATKTMSKPAGGNSSLENEFEQMYGK